MNTVLTQVLKEFVSESWYFPQIRVVDAVEILIITFLFYQIILWIKNTKAWMLLRGILVVALFILVAAVFKMYTILWIAQNSLPVMATAVVIIFQGVPVVAHIFKYRFDDAQRAAMLAAAADAGALGVEVRYTTYTPEQTEIAQALAARFGLAPSGGSDYHGLRKPDIALGSGRGGLRVPYAYLAGLKALAGHECV